MLASKGERVILVDANPQCDLTSMVLGFSTQKMEDRIYKNNQNIKAGLSSAF